MLNSEFELSRTQVMQARFQVCQELRSAEGFHPGEFRNLVLEHMMSRLGIPFVKHPDVGMIPDFKHPLVQRLNQQLDRFEDEICKECTSFD